MDLRTDTQRQLVVLEAKIMHALQQQKTELDERAKTYIDVCARVQALETEQAITMRILEEVLDLKELMHVWARDRANGKTSNR